MSTDVQTARIMTAFQEAGATPVDLPLLQRAETLLDLYGEDIRGRAYTTRDPLAGELMLRPDFTVPVVQMHLDSGADAARYAYAGRVFRMQELNSDRPSEYDQVGFERFGGNSAEAEAEVFALFAEVLKDAPLNIATGDIGVLRAAIESIDTSERRKAALLRHLWRPGRFRKLLDWFAGRPISQDDVDLIDTILGLKSKLPDAAEKLNAMMPGSAPVKGMIARIDALERKGIDVGSLDFEGAYGRTNMEYYDGFVFGFYAAEAPMPPVATGGRYDALTAAMGRAVPAVGGMIRPALVAEVLA